MGAFSSKKNKTGITVDEACSESWPCKHHVVHNGKRQQMGGHEIYELLKENNMPIPDHFKSFENYSSANNV
jgi:hypothetical protein